MKFIFRTFMWMLAGGLLSVAAIPDASFADDTTMELLVNQMDGTKRTVKCREPIQTDSTTMTCDHIAESVKIVVAPRRKDGEPYTVECQERFGLFAYKSGFVKQCLIGAATIVEDIQGEEMRCAGHIVFFGRGGIERCW